jgi:hypothetical protein
MLPGPVVNDAAFCEIDDSGVKLAKGRLFLQPDRMADIPQRGIFVPESMLTRRDEIVLLAASVDSATSRCSAHARIYSVPKRLNPAILFDALLGYLIVATEDMTIGQRGVALIEIVWLLTRDAKTWRVEFNPVTVLTSADAIERVRRKAGAKTVQGLDTWRTEGGRTFRVSDDENWRVIANSAKQVDANPNDWKKLDAASDTSTCFKLNQRLNASVQPNTDVPGVMFEHGSKCFQIKHGQPEYAGLATAPAGAAAAPAPLATAPAGAAPALSPRPELANEDVLVAVYDKPDGNDIDKSLATPIATLRQFGYFGRAQNRWFVGASKRYDGWIALLHPSIPSEKYFGAPWSTQALMLLATDVQKDQPAALPSNAPPPAGSSPPR